MHCSMAATEASTACSKARCHCFSKLTLPSCCVNAAAPACRGPGARDPGFWAAFSWQCAEVGSEGLWLRGGAGLELASTARKPDISAHCTARAAY